MKFFTIITTVVAAAIVTRIGSANPSDQELGRTRLLSHSAHHSKHHHRSKGGKKHRKHGHGGNGMNNNDDSDSDDGAIQYRSSGKHLSFKAKKKKSSSHGLRRSSSSSSTEKDHSYRIELMKGTRKGLCARASGAGAWAKLKGNMRFTLIQMTRSEKYQELKKKYKIGGGVSGFYSFITGHLNAETSREEISKALEEMTSTSTTDGQTTFDLYVSGQKQNVAIEACAYVTIMRFTDEQGNTYDMVSEEASEQNTGAMDTSTGKKVPTEENESTIMFF